MNFDTDMKADLIDENKENEVLRSHTDSKAASALPTENTKQNIVTTMWPDSWKQMGKSHVTSQLQTVKP